jgi:predicted DsbA family dithiol-disulfide isomerase
MAFKKEVVEIIEPRDVFVGNPKAEVTLEEFGEYESEVCAKANEVVKQLLVDYDGKIRFNFRHFPLTNVHQRSLKAGEAAVATAQEGKFWEMHNILFANRRNLGTTSLKLHSKEAGVKNKRFLDDLVNATYGWQVQGDLKEGLDRGVKNVPTFFVNGTMVTGKPTYEELKKAIDSALKKLKKPAAAKAVKPTKVVKAAAPAASKKATPAKVVKPVKAAPSAKSVKSVKVVKPVKGKAVATKTKQKQKQRA